MAAPQVLSLILLGVVLVLAIWRRMNIGVLALAASFVLLWFTDVTAKEMYEKFPGEIVVLIAGVSLLFGHLERSGALRWFVDRVYRVIGAQTAVLPWAGFAIAVGLSSAGAFSTAVIALLVPTIAYVCVPSHRSFYLCELAVVIGANCAGLSPLNPTGALVHETAAKLSASYALWGLWAVSVAVAAVVVAVLQVLDHVRGERAFRVTPAPAAQGELGLTLERPAYALASGCALLVFVLLVVVGKTDVGATSMALVVALQLVFRPDETQLLRRVPWNAIILLAGLLTYLGLLELVGTMDAIEGLFQHIGSQALLVLVLAYLTALLCNIESSTLGVIGLMMPFVFETFGASPQLFWIVAAVAVPAALMVMNPIHVAGTLIIANTQESEQALTFRRLLLLAVLLALVTPGVLALVPALSV